MRIVIDTETTGLHPEQGDEILQVSIIDADTEDVLFNELIRPKKATEWPDAMAVNHITPDMLKDKPYIDEYAPRIRKILSKAHEIIGYNVGFDICFLLCQVPFCPVHGWYIYDVMREYSQKFAEFDESKQRYKWVKLVEAAAHYNYKWDKYPPHDALGDVFATLYVYKRLAYPNLYGGGD